MIPCQRHLFDMPRDVAYLNCAYMSPMLNAAVEAGRAAVESKARPWLLTPAGFLGWRGRARGLFARLIGAEADDVALAPAASYGIATAAANLPLAPGETVVTLADQFPANVYPWRRRAAEAGAEVIAVDAGPDGDLTAAVLAAIDARTAIVAIERVRWTDGALVDLARVGAAARAHGAALVLDLTQCAGAMPFDVAEIRPDFMVAATYKWLLGPYAMGFLYVAPHRQDGRPLEETWLGRAGSEDFSRLVDYRDAYQPGAIRFDMGEASNFQLAPIACAALDQLLAWNVPDIAATLAARNRAIAERAADIGLVSAPEPLRAGHFLGLAFPEGVPTDLPARLGEAGVHVSLRGRSLRVTPHLWTDEVDVDRLFDALGAALARGKRA